MHVVNSCANDGVCTENNKQCHNVNYHLRSTRLLLHGLPLVL